MAGTKRKDSRSDAIRKPLSKSLLLPMSGQSARDMSLAMTPKPTPEYVKSLLSRRYGIDAALPNHLTINCVKAAHISNCGSAKEQSTLRCYARVSGQVRFVRRSSPPPVGWYCNSTYQVSVFHRTPPLRPLKTGDTFAPRLCFSRR